MEITNIDGVLFFGVKFIYGAKFYNWSEFPYRFGRNTYIFLVSEEYGLYKKLHNSDYVTFMVGKDKVTAQIYLIRYLDGYNKYYCQAVERK